MNPGVSNRLITSAFVASPAYRTAFCPATYTARINGMIPNTMIASVTAIIAALASFCFWLA
jgi:hypothetical protein